MRCCWAGPCFAALTGLALFAPAKARAQAAASAASVEAVIEIERAPGSQACPDKEAVFRSIQRLFPERQFHRGSAGAESTARAHVTIRPLAPGHEAVLTLLPPRHGERVIRPLLILISVAVALRLLFDGGNPIGHWLRTSLIR